MRTSYAQGHPPDGMRDGYRVIRRAGRYLVFPRAALSEADRSPRAPRRPGRDLERHAVPVARCGPRGPASSSCTTSTARCGRWSCPRTWPAMGELIESPRRPAPLPAAPGSSRSRESSQATRWSTSWGSDRDRVDGRRPRRSTPASSPAASGRPTPLVVAVGRLVPVKRFDLAHPDDGRGPRAPPDRPPDHRRRGLRAAATSTSWSASSTPSAGSTSPAGSPTTSWSTSTGGRGWWPARRRHEGWGMTLTEAAACGTPGGGHPDPRPRGRGRRRPRRPPRRRRPGAGPAPRAVLSDDSLRTRLGEGARTRAATLTWEATALQTLRALADETLRHRAS